jgi:hypothetical protein
MTQQEAIDWLLEQGWRGKITPRGAAEGFVYLVFTKGGPQRFAKIGFSRSDPRRRMASLQTGCPLHLKLATFFPACRETERHLHMMFASDRASGEWFHWSDAHTERFIRELRLIRYLDEDCE